MFAFDIIKNWRFLLCPRFEELVQEQCASARNGVNQVQEHGMYCIDFKILSKNE